MFWAWHRVLVSSFNKFYFPTFLNLQLDHSLGALWAHHNPSAFTHSVVVALHFDVSRTGKQRNRYRGRRREERTKGQRWREKASHSGGARGFHLPFPWERRIVAEGGIFRFLPASIILIRTLIHAHTHCTQKLDLY